MMVKTTEPYFKVIGINTGLFEAAEIVEEIHREDIGDCTDYIKLHPHGKQTIWLILPQ